MREVVRGGVARLLWADHLFTVSPIHQENGSLLDTTDADL